MIGKKGIKNLSIRSISVILSFIFLVFIYIFVQQRAQVVLLERKIGDINKGLLLKTVQFNEEVKARKSMAGKIIILRGEVLSLKTEREILKRSLEDTRLKLDSVYPRLKERINSLNQSADNLTRERRELKLKIKRLNKEIDFLSKKKKDSESLKQENEKFKAQLQNIEKDYKILSAEKEDLFREAKRFKSIESKIEKLDTENLSLKYRLSNIEEDKNILTREIKILRLTVSELKKGLRKRGKDLEALKTLLEESKVKTGLRAEEILELRDNVDNLAKEREDILKILVDKESKITEKAGAVQALKSKLAEIQKQFQKQREKVLSLNSENKKLKTELKEFQVNYKNLSVVLGDVSDMNAQLQHKISALSSVFDESGKGDIKNEKSVVDLGSMKIDKIEPEVVLTSLIYQLKRSRESASKGEQRLYLEKEAAVHYNLGVYYLKNDRFKEALDEFLKSYEIIPDDADTVYNIGLVYRYYIYDYDKARHYFTQYLKLKPKSKDRKDVENMLREISR
ncbi:MAG: tetratricopeptide repeat protein [Candidatus Kaelpia imicola]|nr:tetratricopeptide repeat protein [Candidatus Kaelpia imicola]